MDKDILVLVINAILVPVLLWGLAELSAMIHAKTKKITDATTQAYADSAVDRAEKVIRTVVYATTQKFVDELKKAGTFDKSAQAAAFNQSMEAAKQILGTDGLEALRLSFEDVQAWIEAQIDAAVRSQKPVDG